MKLKIILLIGIICMLIISPIMAKKIDEKLDYYAYGDSVTNATIGVGLPAEGSATYILQMQKTFDKKATADWFEFGSGWTSKKGYENIGLVLNKESKVHTFVFMFGINDLSARYTPSDIAQNISRMYQYARRNSSHVVVMIQTMFPTNTARIWTTQQNQTKQILEIERKLDKYKIPYFKTYDTIDLIPGNGYPDGVNLSYQAGGGSHPNIDGHKAIAVGLWKYIHPRNAALEKKVGL